MKLYTVLASICVLSSLVACMSDSKKCELIGRGSVCDDELLGYYDCDGSSPDGVYHKCNTGYMCACGINRRCGEIKDKCVKRPSLPDVPKDFIVSFAGERNVSFPTGSRRESVKGTAWQDFSSQMLLVKADYSEKGKFDRKVTELTRKITDHPNFVKYVLTEYKDGTSHCVATDMTKFKDLFHDLRLLSYGTSSPNIFIYKDGPIHGGDNAVVQTWEYTNLNGLQFSPRFYSFMDTGSHLSKTAVSMKIRDGYFHMVRPHSVTFRVPSKCANTVIN